MPLPCGPIAPVVSHKPFGPIVQFHEGSGILNATDNPLISPSRVEIGDVILSVTQGRAAPPVSLEPRKTAKSIMSYPPGEWAVTDHFSEDTWP